MSIAIGCPPVNGKAAAAKPPAPAVVMAFPYMV
jgi:hypothetical protein